MNERKKRLFPDYELIEKDDIRTIPDFYDNLYPSFENFTTNCIINAPRKSYKKEKNSKIVRNKEN